MNWLKLLGWLAAVGIALFALGSLVGLRELTGDTGALAVLGLVVAAMVVVSLLGRAYAGRGSTTYW